MERIKKAKKYIIKDREQNWSYSSLYRKIIETMSFVS